MTTFFSVITTISPSGITASRSAVSQDGPPCHDTFASLVTVGPYSTGVPAGTMRLATTDNGMSVPKPETGPSAASAADAVQQQIAATIHGVRLITTTFPVLMSKFPSAAANK